MKRLTLAEWQAAGLARFGHAEARLWLFVCPSCGEEQTYRDLRDLGVPHPERYFAYSCIGRFNLNVPARADSVVVPPAKSNGFGCTYTSGIANHITPVIVEISPGEERPFFEFAP